MLPQGTVLIRITSTPAGEVPEDIRRQWIGCQMLARPYRGPAFGVLTEGRLPAAERYAVVLKDAVFALVRCSNGSIPVLQAAVFWATHFPPSEDLLFEASCCEAM